MLDSLSTRLQAIFDKLGGRGRLSEENIQEALREVRVALLEADVNFKVVRAFVDRVRTRAVGQDVLASLTPAQQVVKVVHGELVELLGGSGHRLAMASHPPTVIMLMGLQGSGKTTTAAKLARRSVDDEIAAVAPHLKLLADNGAAVMVYGEVSDSFQGASAPLYKRPRFFRPEQWREYGEKLTAFARHTLRHGVRVAYHHHMGTVVETQREIDLLMENTGSAVGLLIDTGHLTYAGADVLETTRRHARRINHVHCKDIRAGILKTVRRNDQSFLRAILDGVFTVPGDGFIDYSAFARVLADIGYEGWAVVEAEQDPVKAPPLEYSRIGLQHLMAAFEAAGFDFVK